MTFSPTRKLTAQGYLVAASASITLALMASPALAGARLAQCKADLSTCNSDLGESQATLLSCNSDLDESQAGLAACQSDLAALASGCDATFACPPPSDANHQTICGQVFDLENGSRFQALNAAGTQCTALTALGPCSLKIVAYDAIEFAGNPTGAQPLTSGDPVYVDDCGRYRVTDIPISSFGFVALVIDDADAAKRGRRGSTNTVSVAKPNQKGLAAPEFDLWVASKATTDLWESSGGPPVSGGIYIPVFHEMAAKTNRDLQDGVTVTRNDDPVPTQDEYFVSTESARRTIDPAATVTGVNGTALVVAAGVPVSYSGVGGNLPAECRWATHLGSAPPFILWVQDFRPQNESGQICDR